MKVRDFIKVLQDIPEEYQDLEIEYDEDLVSTVTFTGVTLPEGIDYSTGLSTYGFKPIIKFNSTCALHESIKEYDYFKCCSCNVEVFNVFLWRSHGTNKKSAIKCPSCSEVSIEHNIINDEC